MAIADDFTVAVNGDIRHSANTNHYSVLELHRFLQDLADDEFPATADDYVAITSDTPSERSTDGIIELINGYNIDDDAAEYFFGGSITQEEGDTVYSGLKVLGAVNNSGTQLIVVQDHEYYDAASPFWGDQSGGGYNGDAAGGVLMRILVKSREFGADIDQKNIRVQARSWGDSYDFFNTTLGEGEAVAAISTTPDAQNTTGIATVQAWAGGDIPTNTEGWQNIDINNGNGNKEYYSKWTFNTNSLEMKAIWEWIKEITGNDSPEAVEPYDMNGEFFLGLTHSCAYDGETGALTQNEKIVWGTSITYGTLVGGTFSSGDYVVIKRAGTIINAGKVGYDNGSTDMVIALEDIGTAIAQDDTMEEASVGTVTAVVSATFSNEDKGGGEAIMLAENVSSDDVYFQLISGVAPVDDLTLRGLSSGFAVDVAGAVTPETVPKTFLGSYTGSLIGAFGVGIDADDLASTDTVQPLIGVAQTPPNNVTFTLSGLVAGDRVLIGNKDTGDAFEWTEMTIDTGHDLTTGAETIVDVGTAGIPADTPSTGILRIVLDDGRIMRVPYLSHDGDDEFTIGSTDFSGTKEAAAGNGVMLAFIDKAAASDVEDFTLQFDAIRTLWIRVRDGGATPIKTYEAQGSLGTSGGSGSASRIDDY